MPEKKIPYKNYFVSYKFKTKNENHFKYRKIKKIIKYLVFILSKFWEQKKKRI